MEGQSDGAVKLGNTWAIPEDANKQVDACISTGKYIKNHEYKQK